jgi:hypothetical protein
VCGRDRADTPRVGEVIQLRTLRRMRYEAAGLDRLLAELDRRRLARAAGDRVLRDARRPTGTVIPFRLADR